MDSLIFELQIVFYFQLFLSANVRHSDLCDADYVVYTRDRLTVTVVYETKWSETKRNENL